MSRAKNFSLGQSSTFFIANARKAFIELKQTFVEALILNYFDLKRHIKIEMDISGYAIGAILNQQTSDDLNQWHLVAFFSER